MHETRSPAWPFAGIIGCLFAITLFATWSWQQTGAAPARLVMTVPPPTISLDSSAVDGVAEPGGVGPVIGPAEGAYENASRKPLAPIPARSSDLGPVAATGRDARPVPPVAERISLDTSLAELPSLSHIQPSPRSELTRGGGHGPRITAAPTVSGVAGSLSRQGFHQSPDIATSWPYPTRLVESLESLGADPATRAWSERLRARLKELHATGSLDDSRAGVVLEELQRLTHEGMAISRHLNDLNQQAATMRVAYALQRRLAIWQPVHQLAVPTVTQVSLRDRDPSELTRKLHAVVGQLTRLSNARGWREYLLLDQLAQIASRQWSTSCDERSRLAREFLRRLESADATREQEAFFAEHDWREFAQEMRQWICEPVDYQVLLDDLERVETNRSEKAARDLAKHYQILRWSTNAQIEDLGERINTYYRNANVRVAISGELLNRLLPRPRAVDENVNDQLMGGRVFGRSRVSTRLRLVLLPDRKRWRLELEARGNVDSKTETKRGPARFHNAGRSRYLASKLLLIDRRGVHTKDAEAAAATNAELTRMETDMDGVPLVNLLVRAIAKQQYDSRADDVKYEAEGLLANRVRSRLDREVDQKLSDATSKFRSEILAPLRGLGLRPEAIDMRTTEQHLIVRYRLASFEQAGAFSPRPQAPSDSLLSIQVHQSALNNVVASLNLGRSEVGLRELFVEVASKLQREDFQVPENVPDDVSIKFTEHDPISFECKDDRIHLTLRIAKLVNGDGRTWRNFEVRGMYVPDIEGVRVGLQRDSYIRLKGSKRRLSTLDTAALRTVFTKVMAKHPDVDLLANVILKDKRLHDLRVSQFVIRDGWIGIAVGVGNPVRMRIADEPRTSVTR